MSEFHKCSVILITMKRIKGMIITKERIDYLMEE